MSGGAGGSPQTIVFDVTSAVRRQNERAVGIVRVQLLCAAALLERHGEDVAFTAWSRPLARFVQVPREEVLALLRSGDRSPSRSVLVPRRRYLPQIVLRLLGRVRRYLARMAAAPCHADGWSATTTYVSVGIDFHDGDVSQLAMRRAQRGFRTVMMVHDLIPVVAPHLSAGGTADHYARLLAAADVVLVPSESTGKDVAAFAAERRLPAPTLHRLPMISAFEGTRRGPGGPPPVEPPFVLYVSTIEIRKNHHLLLDVWEMMAARRDPDQVPRLVLVGRRGWLCEETMSRIDRTPALRGVVIHLPDEDDDRLRALYEHARFTVFPSLYEGWGLPVTESLSLGTPCLTSDRSSLPEAGAGCTRMLDPFDRVAWFTAFESLLDHPDDLEQWRRDVLAHFVPPAGLADALDLALHRTSELSRASR